jgi:hypothetical protein
MTLAEELVKINRWITLTAAILITLCEVLVFTSQSARVPEMQANAGAGSDVGRGGKKHPAYAGAASIYRAAATGTRTGERVR